MRIDDDSDDEVGELLGNDATGAEDDETSNVLFRCNARALLLVNIKDFHRSAECLLEKKSSSSTERS
jgi:hypothetical protein